MSPTALARLPRRQGLRPRSIPARVLNLLARDPSKAWRHSELSKALGVAHSSLGPALSRLRAKGLVAVQDGHWYAKAPAGPKSQAYAATFSLAQEKWGTEDPSDWPLLG